MMKKAEVPVHGALGNAIEVKGEWLDYLLQLEQRQEYNLGAAFLDAAARQLWGVLDKETSVKWAELPGRLNLPWADICRGVAILASAGLCEAGSVHLTISELGDRILAQERNR